MPLGDKRAADLVAVYAGQVAVEHEHVVVGEREVRERVVAVERDVDGHALAAQARSDRLGQLDVILDQQYSHRPLQRGASAVTARLQRRSPWCNRPFRRTPLARSIQPRQGDDEMKSEYSGLQGGGPRAGSPEQRRTRRTLRRGDDAHGARAARRGLRGQLPEHGRGAPRVEHFRQHLEHLERLAGRLGRGLGVARHSQAVAYSGCMRAHGVPNFPDPQVSASGNEVKVAIEGHTAITGNPHFKSAQQACSKLLPGGGPGRSSHPISPQEQSQYLKAAACIRSHGIPNFPDPTFSGGGVHVSQQGDRTCTRHRSRAAEEACQSLIPGGLHGNR